jgi:ubiquinone/menaquinone biosynthesis C-methylase UbiE
LSAPALRSDWELFLSMLAPVSGDRILDVGAGKGSVAARIQKDSKGTEVYAVDPNAKKIAAMKRNFPMVKGSVAGAENLPYPDVFFDRAYATMALHHFADLDKALGEVARVLKHEGSFVVLEVDPSSGKGRLFRFFGRLTGEHMSLMREDQLAARLGASKVFKVERTVRVGSGYVIQLRHP